MCIRHGDNRHLEWLVWLVTKHGKVWMTESSVSPQGEVRLASSTCGFQSINVE